MYLKLTAVSSTGPAEVWTLSYKGMRIAHFATRNLAAFCNAFICNKFDKLMADWPGLPATGDEICNPDNRKRRDRQAAD